MKNNNTLLIFLFLLILPKIVLPQENTVVSMPDSTATIHADSITNDTFFISDTALASHNKKDSSKNNMDTIYYEAEQIHYDIENRILILHDDAVTKYQNITLFVDTIV